jgi:beta-ureidopropionase / N-carbamoyl-L-amino-acid hydrolase
MSPPNLKVDAERLWGMIEATAAFGAIPGGGLDRQALTEPDRAVRDWFRATCETLGCSVAVDEMGNMFARRAGRRDDLPPIAVGSHLDTQPTGGRFDGVLGVLAGVEILHVLAEADYVTEAPLEIVNWTNEEGARFAPAMLASGVFAGVYTPDYARGRRDAAGVSFGEALEAIGYRGPEPAGARKLGALLELHIEQGPVLEAEDTAIGVVTGGQGARWYDCTFRGGTGHTGATPMRLRRNALVGAARLVVAMDAIAADAGPDAVASVGRLEVSPNSRNVIPGEVRFSVDLRHPDDGVLDAMASRFEALFAETAEALRLDHDMERVLTFPAVRFDPKMIACVEAGAERAGARWRHVVSGAAHDAVYIARVVPTTMIFVPCREGISHNVAEFASKAHCALGTQVVLNAVLALDAA